MYSFREAIETPIPVLKIKLQSFFAIINKSQRRPFKTTKLDLQNTRFAHDSCTWAVQEQEIKNCLFYVKMGK